MVKKAKRIGLTVIFVNGENPIESMNYNMNCRKCAAVLVATFALLLPSIAMAASWSGTLPVMFITTNGGTAITSKED